MDGHGRPRQTILFLLIFHAAVLFSAIPAAAQSPARAAGKQLSSETSPREDDAALYDVAFIGTKNGWAVGDLGVVWNSRDGGESWTLIPTPVKATLRSASFLTDRVGWIVGMEMNPYTRLGSGVVFTTQDAGKTWQVLASGKLPPLVYVKFFDLQNGVAVGESTSEHPSGVFHTEDGGKTWRIVPGPVLTGWRAADFLTPEVGATAGLRGRVALVGGGRMLKPRMSDLGLRGLRGVALQKDKTGWLVGDGGLALRTDNGGIVWEEPEVPLPDELRDITDFRTVAVRGMHAWIAGSPGSVIWHSPDDGASWQKGFTGQTAPIHSLTFTSETNGWAVGEFGMILRTTDGGETWTAARGGGRRIAMLCVHAWPGRVSFELIAKEAGEEGYRSAVLLPPRHDVGPDGQESRDLDLRLKEAVLHSGGSAAELGWRFPIGIPGIDKDAEKLAADWNRWSEGRLPQIFLGSLVACLRTWRPSIVVLDQPPADDAASQLLNEAVLKAVEQAGDATRYIQHQELAGLAPWNVERVYVRLPPGSTGQTSIDPHEYLARCRRTAQVLAEAPRRLVAPTARPSAVREPYRLVFDRTTDDIASAKARDFFVGLALAPGSDARRALSPLGAEDDSAARLLANRERNFHSFVEKFAADPRQGSQLLAQMREVTAGMSPDQAAMQLVHLREEYRRLARWDLVESTSIELVMRYPNEPAALESMAWLLQLWTGIEPGWQRARRTGSEMKRLEANHDRIYERIIQASKLAALDPAERDLSTLDVTPDPLKFSRVGGEVQIEAGKSWRGGAVAHWHEQALRMASLIRSRDAALYKQPEVQFPLAALMRHRGTAQVGDSVYRRFAMGPAGDPWRKTAETELWLVQPLETPPKPIATCRATAKRPVLDGILSDECWQSAQEIALRSKENDESRDGKYALAMIAYDAEYLYVGISVPRSEAAPRDRPERGGRSYDSDLSRHDRVSLYLDLDRDYATYYAFHVDQRGWTAESCWDDASWNPKWHVAASADAESWSVELAIPFAELGPAPPVHDTTWAAGLVRTIPTAGYESWTHPAGAKPRPESFGLIRFE